MEKEQVSRKITSETCIPYNFTNNFVSYLSWEPLSKSMCLYITYVSTSWWIYDLPKLLEQVVALDPTWPDGFALLGRAYTRAGKREEAKKAFATAQKLSAEERQRLERAVTKPKPQ